MYEIFAQLLQKRGVTAYQVSKATGVAQSSLSDWKRGKSRPKYEKLKKIADYFGVPVDIFLDDKEETKKAPTLTKRDERQIEKILEETRLQLENTDGLMFDGDPASPEAIESLLDAMRIGLELAKQKNKEKYTPKKYRKG